MTSWVNKELTRFGDCKICHHVDDSPTSKFSLYRLFFCFFEEVQGVQQERKKKNPDATGKLNTCTHTTLEEHLKFSFFEKEIWLWKCILPVFCCFPPQPSGFLCCLLTLPKKNNIAKGNVNFTRIIFGVWVESIVLFRLKTAKCRNVGGCF